MALVTAVQIAMTNKGIEKLIDSLVLGNTINISKFRLSKNGDDAYYNALRDFRTVYEVDGVISGVDTSSTHPLLYYMPFTADEFSSKNGEPIAIPPGTPDTNNIINLADYGLGTAGFIDILSVEKVDAHSLQMECYVPPTMGKSFTCNEIMVYYTTDTGGYESFMYGIFPLVTKDAYFGLNLRVILTL